MLSATSLPPLEQLGQRLDGEGIQLLRGALRRDVREDDPFLQQAAKLAGPVSSCPGALGKRLRSLKCILASARVHESFGQLELEGSIDLRRR